MKKLAIVTVNFNTDKDTDTLLESIQKLDTNGLTVTTIVVDNGSTTPYKLDKKFENTLFIRSDENTGFSGGYNIGMKKALEEGADYILIVNNDTLMDRHMLQELVKAFEINKKIGVTTPKIYFAKGHEFHKDRYKKEELGKVFWYAGGYTDWANVKSVHRGVDEVDHGQYDKTEKTTFASGCCMLFKREVLEKVGLFDNKFFLYYEDADLNERIQRAGFAIYYVPKAVLVHINAASSGGAGNPLQDYFITRNQMLFGMKYAPHRTKIALIRQSIRLYRSGRPNQKKAIRDYYRRKLGKGSFFNK